MASQPSVLCMMRELYVLNTEVVMGVLWLCELVLRKMWAFDIQRVIWCMLYLLNESLECDDIWIDVAVNDNYNIDN